MDQEGSSSRPEFQAPADVEMAAQPTTREDDRAAERKKRKEKEKEQEIAQVEPEDSDDEEYASELAGAKNYPPHLWERLNTPMAKGQWTIDTWEIRMSGEILQWKISAGGKNHDIWFTPRSREDFKMRKNFWIPREENTFKCHRTRLYSLPKTTTVHKLIFYNTPDCEAEDCFIEFMFIKKWQCKVFEYNICSEFYQPDHLRKLIHMFKPIDIMVYLTFGPYQPPQHGPPEPAGLHNHLAALADGRMSLERDFRMDCTHALNRFSADPTKKDLRNLYSAAGKGKTFGVQMIRTLCSLRKFVSMMVEKQMAQTKGMAVRKFIVKACCNNNRTVAPMNEKICTKLATLLKEDGTEEATKKRASYAVGDKMFVCVRHSFHNQLRYSLSMPTTAFKMVIGNEQFLHYTKSIMNFQCLFRTTVDETGVKQFISEWQKGDRQIDEIQLHVDKVFDSDFCNGHHPDMGDPKRIKIRSLARRQTMYIERDRLATRHLSIRVLDNK